MQYSRSISNRKLCFLVLFIFSVTYICFAWTYINHGGIFRRDGTEASLDLSIKSVSYKVFQSNKRLEAEIREMLSIHASMRNEMLQVEQTRRSLIQMKSELETQVMKLRSDVAFTERDLQRLQATVASYQRVAKILSSNISTFNTLPSLSYALLGSPLIGPETCNMAKCFNWTACPMHSTAQLRVCFRHNSAVPDPKWQRALLTSPHFSTSCDRACLRVIFAPENCTQGDGPSCLFFGEYIADNAPNKHVIHAASGARTDLRPGFDLVIAPLNDLDASHSPPLFARRQTKWLLGAHVGTADPREGRAASAFMKELISGADPINVVFKNATEEACWSETQKGRNVLWQPCETSDEVLANSTFCLLIDSLTENRTGAVLGAQLTSCLRNAAIPVLINGGEGEEWRLFPFWEVLEPHWRRSVVFLPRPRLPHLLPFLRSFDSNTRVEMQRQGRSLFRKYLASVDLQLATAFLTLSRRLGLPQPPAPTTRSIGALVGGRLEPERLYTPRAEVLLQVDVDGLLGPLGPKWDSPSRPSSMVVSAAGMMAKEDMFWSHANTPWSVPPLPTEFQFVGTTEAGNGDFRPINHTLNTAGVEFAADLGGMYPYEQFTIVVLAYDRESVLTLMLEGLNNLAYLHSVVVIWNNPKPPTENLPWPKLHVPIYVIKGGKNSLNNRFLPFDILRTEALLMLDDDVTLRHDEIVLAFRVWRENRDRIVGFPARGHFWSPSNHSWYYNSAHACEYSMVLTGAAFIHRYYLHAYTNEMAPEVRKIVDEELNCEDIAMNFLVSHITRKPPLKVTTHWSFICPSCNSTLYSRQDHKEVRSVCINKFERIYGYNPLIYTQYRGDSVLFKTRLPVGMQKCFRYV